MNLRPPDHGDDAIWRIWLAAFHAPTLAIADELGVFTELARAPADSAALARALGIEERATETIAGLMVSLGFLASTRAGFTLTDVARTYLLPESPYYWGGLLRRIRDNPLDCKKLVDALRRGRAAAEARLTGMWQAPAPPDDALVAFTRAMHAHSFGLAMRAIHHFDLEGARLLDAGGGSGSYSIATALQVRDARCTVLDLPAVCGVASAYAAEYGVADRVATASGDMFVDPWPSDHDRVLFSDIFHDWDDERCFHLARRAHAALPRGGRVLVHEMLLDEDKLGSEQALSYSMIMVFVAQGRQRSASEVATILGAAGFSDVATAVPTANGFSLITAVR